jgi:hypothetical protein
MVKAARYYTEHNLGPNSRRNPELDSLMWKIRLHYARSAQLKQDEFETFPQTEVFSDYFDTCWSRRTDLRNYELVQDPNDALELLVEDTEVLSRAQKYIQEILFEVDDYVRRLKEFFSILGLDNQEKYDYTIPIASMTLLSFLGELPSAFKWWVNELFCSSLDLERPEPYVFSTIARRIFPRLYVCTLRRKCSSRNPLPSKKTLFLLYSLFQGLKKGLLPIGPHKVDLSLQKHRKALTKLPPDGVGEFIYFCQRKIRSDKQYRKLIVPPRVLARKELLSTKGTIENARNRGGQVGWSYHHGYPTSDVTEDFRTLNEDDPLPDGALSIPRFDGYVEISIREESFPFAYVSRQLRPVYSTKPSEFELLEYYGGPGKPSNCVQPVVVLEPLKGRIITKPSAGLYIGYKSINSFWNQRLHKMDTFCLTGRPVSMSDVAWIDEEQPDLNFVSGDYSAATDNLNGRVSEALLRSLFCKLPQGFTDKAVESFCHTKLDYSSEPLKGANLRFECVSSENIRQENGQLMGHLLSFPVLCLANRLALEYVFEYLLHKPTPRALINGDDILFKCDESDYDVWRSFVKTIGFEPSLGKNLFHERLAQINSVLFQKADDDEIIPVPFLNMGIITGRKKGRETKTLAEIKNDDIWGMVKEFCQTRDDLKDNIHYCFPYIDEDLAWKALLLNRPKEVQCLDEWGVKKQLTSFGWRRMGKSDIERFDPADILSDTSTLNSSLNWAFQEMMELTSKTFVGLSKRELRDPLVSLVNLDFWPDPRVAEGPTEVRALNVF